MEFLSSRDHKPPMKGIINKVLYNMLYFFRCIIISTFKLSFIDTIFGKKRNIFEKSCHCRQQKNILSIFPRFFPYPAIQDLDHDLSIRSILGVSSSPFLLFLTAQIT